MQDDYYYTIRVNDVRIDDHSFLGAAYLAVIDSGSTLSHFPRQVFEDLRAYLISQYGLPSGVIDGEQYVLSDPSSTWPVIDIYVDGVYLSLPPSVYFLKVSSLWSSRWLFGIASSDTSVRMDHASHIVLHPRRYLHECFPHGVQSSAGSCQLRCPFLLVSLCRFLCCFSPRRVSRCSE